ncbi:MAG: hypothetical protein ACE15F_11830 [bacterium]
MTQSRLPFDEFKNLFQEEYPSEERLQWEYDQYQPLIEELGHSPVPPLPPQEKAAIFEATWDPVARRRAWMPPALAWFYRPAVTFAWGLFVGCFLTAGSMNGWFHFAQPVSAQPVLTIEKTGHTQIVKGQLIDQLYANLENPQIVVEKKEEAAPPQRVLYGTLDHGQIYVVYNL